MGRKAIEGVARGASGKIKTAAYTAAKAAKKEVADRNVLEVAKYEALRTLLPALAEDMAIRDGLAFSSTSEENIQLYHSLAGPDARTIYVIAAAGGPSVKIGVASDPLKRLAQLQTGHDRRLVYCWGVRMSKKDAFRVESGLHARLRFTLNHQVGEWYWLDRFAAREAVKHEINHLKARWIPGWSMPMEDGALSGLDGEVRFPLVAFKSIFASEQRAI